MKLDDELKTLIDDAIKERIKTAKQGLVESTKKDVVSWVTGRLKALGALVVPSVALLGFLGYSSWSAIRAEALEHAKERVEHVIATTDRGEGLSATLDALLNRTIVSSALAEAAHTGASPELSANEWVRVQHWAQQESIDLPSFSDALALMNDQSSERKATVANEFVAEMLGAPNEGRFPWMCRRPNYRQTILLTFRHEDLALAAADIALNHNLPEKLQVAGARYARLVGSRSAAQRVLSEADPSTLVGREALISAALLCPESDTVRTRVGTLVQSNMDDFGATLVSAVFGAPQVANGEARISTAAEEHDFISPAESLLTWALRKGGSLCATELTVRTGRDGPADSGVPERRVKYSLRWPETVQPRSDLELGDLSALMELQPYRSAIEHAMRTLDGVALGALLPQPQRNSRLLPRLAVSLYDLEAVGELSVVIEFDDGTTESLPIRADTKQYLYRIPGATTLWFWITWIDGATMKSGKVIRFDGDLTNTECELDLEETKWEQKLFVGHRDGDHGPKEK